MPNKNPKNIHRHFKLTTFFFFSLIIAPLFVVLINIKTNNYSPTNNQGKPAPAGLINEQEILTLVNKIRLNSGLNALALNDQLNKAAMAKAEDIFVKQYFAHTSPENKKFFAWIEESGYQYIYAGENLAADFYTPDGVINAWMMSPTHRKNLLNNRYWETGVAVKNGLLNNKETTIIVQLFGVEKNSPSNPNLKTSAANIYKAFVLPYLLEYSLTPTGENDFEVANVD